MPKILSLCKKYIIIWAETQGKFFIDIVPDMGYNNFCCKEHLYIMWA